MNYKQILQDNLRSILTQRGLTQAKLAEMTSMTEATISRYLSGTHVPNIEYTAIIAEALNVSIDFLLGLSDSSLPNEPPSGEMRALFSSYSRADAHCKKMVWMQLEPFMTDYEKESALEQSGEQSNTG